MNGSDEIEVLENAERTVMQERLAASLAEQQKLREAGDPERLALDQRLEEMRQARTAAWVIELIATGELDGHPIEDMSPYQYAAE